jgi:hypothetical protein
MDRRDLKELAQRALEAEQRLGGATSKVFGVFEDGAMIRTCRAPINTEVTINEHGTFVNASDIDGVAAGAAVYLGIVQPLSQG